MCCNVVKEIVIKQRDMAGFTFRQFEIHQERCAMKVGTDGVLLGAWAEGGRRVLDIGSGTGLVSLMMAQRFPEASVVGIDLDADACEEAAENVAASPFAGRVAIVHARLQDFMVDADGEAQGGNTDTHSLFDAIVSNPPFFVNSLKNPDNKRSMARHADSLPFQDLWKGVKRLLSEDGVFSVVLPKEVVELFVAEGCVSGFCLVRRCAVKTVARKPPKRYLLSFSRHRTGVMEDAGEVMMDGDGNRSDWYRKITDDFYL